jgi:hypothetical protein
MASKQSPGRSKAGKVAKWFNTQHLRCAFEKSKSIGYLIQRFRSTDLNFSLTLQGRVTAFSEI